MALLMCPYEAVKGVHQATSLMYSVLFLAFLHRWYWRVKRIFLLKPVAGTAWFWMFWDRKTNYITLAFWEIILKGGIVSSNTSDYTIFVVIYLSLFTWDDLPGESYIWYFLVSKMEFLSFQEIVYFWKFDPKFCIRDQMLLHPFLWSI